jgi:hypothetical protein
VKIGTVWPFFVVETTRARDGYFDIFWYNGTVPLPRSIEFAAENLPAWRSVSRPFFEFVCLKSLDDTFPAGWIGLEGPVSWFSLSPDITLLDVSWLEQ